MVQSMRTGRGVCAAIREMNRFTNDNKVPLPLLNQIKCFLTNLFRYLNTHGDDEDLQIYAIIVSYNYEKFASFVMLCGFCWIER